MTAKTHYAIYALLGVIILLLLYFVISERSARNTDIQSLQSQITEATFISDEEAIDMVQKFAMIGCTKSGELSDLNKRLIESSYSKWSVRNRDEDSITVGSRYDREGIKYLWLYEINQISRDTKIITRLGRFVNYGESTQTRKYDFDSC